MSMMTKSFEQAIEACGGKDAAHKVLDRYLKAVATAKVKATETKLLVDWALKQQNRPATQVVG